MGLIGMRVNHKSFGYGKIVDKTNDYIKVDFNGVEKRFIYPDAFKVFLQIDDTTNEKIIQEDILKREKEKQILQHKNEHMLNNSQIESLKVRKKAKLNSRANVAFKCNYCDGGGSQNHIGYRSACSDSVIIHNIREGNKVWCSSQESPCRQYFEGNLSRQELDDWCKDDGFVCYESQMLREWKAMAGIVQTGKNKGQAMKLNQVQNNSLCVLTTRKPYMKEEDRFIFGVFLVDETYEGDNRDEGYVTTSSKYKIELAPQEAIAIKFWNYYANGNQSEKPMWSSGLHRYFEDSIAVQILRDIAKTKKGTTDEQLAQEFLEYFCKVNGVIIDTVEEPYGALLREKMCIKTN